MFKYYSLVMEVDDESKSESTQADGVIREGKANIRHPSFVFYNKVQEFNRDLTIHLINTYLKYELWKDGNKNKSQFESYSTEGITIVDALSATGLRSVRYALECADKYLVKSIIANDISKKAIETIEENIQKNNVEHIVKANHQDAALFLYMNRGLKQRFTIVDIDPYGCPAPFLDAAVQSVVDGGMLMVTSTDMAILCGNHTETCYAKYGSISLKSKFCHEMALRIILRSIESQANKYGRYIIPLVSLSIDFYARVFVQVFTSPSEAKRSASKSAYVYLCTGCESFELQRLCVVKNKKQKSQSQERDQSTSQENGEDYSNTYSPSYGPVVDRFCQHCGKQFVVGGPIWADSIHSGDFLGKMKSSLNTMINENNEEQFATQKRLHGLVHLVSEELPNVPLHYCLDRLCKIVHCRVPPMKVIRSAILNSGFSVSYSHTCKTSIKTNAPSSLIWNIIRKWCQISNSEINLKEHEPGYKILEKEITDQVSFEIHQLAEPFSKEMQLLRYQMNPQENWGPKSKPSKDNQQDKRASNQGKNTIKKVKLLKEFPCKKFQSNNCDLGDSCKYSHSK